MESSLSAQTDTKPTTKRCINIDWLEVHAREPIGIPHNAAYFFAQGFVVHEREYGTRVYREMFVLEGTDGENLLEVRRNPASQGQYGIHDPNECHIRLVNRTCYYDNAAAAFDEFLREHGYYDVRISRIDICLDFVTFDKGDNPQAFVRRYFRHKYAKINQGNISSHGSDNWSGQEWNSLSWGSKSSSIGTKLYDKTMELYDPKEGGFRKPYIRYAWFLCGLVDDWQNVTKNGEKVQVWRVEFSIRSSVKNWVQIELDGEARHYQSLKNTLDCYMGRDKLLVIFASLANHYFHFKKFKEGKRKDRCPDKVLFDFSGMQLTYKIGRNDYNVGSGEKKEQRYFRLIERLKEYGRFNSNIEVTKACKILIESMEQDNLRSDLTTPWSREELAEVKRLMKLSSSSAEMTLEAAMNEIKALLKINDKTAKF